MSDTIHIQIDRADGSLQRLIGLVERRGFHIERVDLSESVPSSVSSLVVLGPKAVFTDWQLYQMDQFVMV